MLTTTAFPSASAARVGPDVWDRVWRSAPDERKDEMILRREAAGPRWSAIRAALLAQSGRLDGLRTVELGSGRGDVSVLLSRAGADVTLVDYCPRALDHARARFDRLGLSARFIHADFLQDLGGLANRFDFAVSVGVIEHFKGDLRTAALKAHRDVLAPRGVAAVSVPYACCPTYRAWKAWLQLRRWWPYGQEIPYTRRELRRRARSVGLGDIRLTTHGWRESLTDHGYRQLLRRSTPVDYGPSRLDRWLGAMLLMLARRDDEQAALGCVPSLGRRSTDSDDASAATNGADTAT